MYNPERFNAFSNDRNSAFYFTSIEEQKVLVQINKDSGEKIDGFIFYDNKPQYDIDQLEKKIYYRKGNQLHIYHFK